MGHSCQHWAAARRTAFFAATRIVPPVSRFLPRHLFVPPAPSRTSYNKPDGRIFTFIFLEPKNARHGFMVLRLTDCGLLPMVPCTHWPSSEDTGPRMGQRGPSTGESYIPLTLAITDSALHRDCTSFALFCLLPTFSCRAGPETSRSRQWITKLSKIQGLTNGVFDSLIQSLRARQVTTQVQFRDGFV